jgi:hypothetical protein
MINPLANVRAAAPPTSGTPAEAYEPAGEVTTGGATGLVVDSHRTARRTLTGLGVGVALAGVGLLAAAKLRPTMLTGILGGAPVLPLAISGAVLGAG